MLQENALDKEQKPPEQHNLKRSNFGGPPSLPSPRAVKIKKSLDGCYLVGYQQSFLPPPPPSSDASQKTLAPSSPVFCIVLSRGKNEGFGRRHSLRRGGGGGGGGGADGEKSSPATEVH